MPSPTTEHICPDCGEEMEFNPKDSEGDPNLINGTREIPAHYACDCGHVQDAEIRAGRV